nr:hypothetical protein [Treponema sp.]
MIKENRNLIYISALFVGAIFMCDPLFSRGKKDFDQFEEALEVNQESSNEVELNQESLPPVQEPLPPVQLYTLRPVEGEPVEFAESWGYVSAGREDEYNSSLPITDVCYFSAEI